MKYREQTNRIPISLDVFDKAFTSQGDERSILQEENQQYTTVSEMTQQFSHLPCPRNVTC